jgi:hypothetical protein
MAPKDDRRLPAVAEAVRFWNGELTKLSSPFRLGPIRHEPWTVAIDDFRPYFNPKPTLDDFQQIFDSTTNTFGLPKAVRQTSGDIIVVLSDGQFTSFTFGWTGQRKAMIAIESLPTMLMTRNVIAHELGHVIGLRDNHDPASLMCGSPRSWCNILSLPEESWSLTRQEQEKLLKMYPPDWLWLDPPNNMRRDR